MSKAETRVEGFVANDLEVRDVNGHRVVKVSVPHTPRKLDKATNTWVDAGDTAWFTASFWDDAVEPIVDAVIKGVLVTITGQPTPRGYTKQDGTIAVETELKFATLGVIPRADTRRAQAQSAPAQSQEPWDSPANLAANPWATPAVVVDEKPF